ncbi:hypothetical protein BU25DRAFT_409876 [Macroventuria anomochaeta]|uniref:Uncharacterized protein n=1 Tax=Macroventuria anomochaeta TaxID=301207 RepID=A0ACB6S4F9_9PLEO|nr:uncharacterized protein BU25DRAFT_409876 [Macroventuria anomochaeta]KAF2628862.1 hypothetical protein BU25DRAFT_409876 [Macroventuria anomochaeta]
MARQLRREDYTVGWVCALPVELAAAQEMLDEEHPDLDCDLTNNDENLYALGSIGGHNVAIVCLPAGRIGNNPAAAVAMQMRATFKKIRFGLMVGIGGGVPSAEADVRLGDVVVSQPHGMFAGVVQYDAGKTIPSGFERTGSLNSPPQVLLAAVARVRANELRGRSKLRELVAKLEGIAKFQRSKAGPDVLFEAAYDHKGGQTCDGCSLDRQEARLPRDSEEEVAVHYGTIASGNQVIKNAALRDRLSAELGGVLCFEMEAAGLMNSFPCLVVRGVCDYADSHKNKRWQAYAAGTAAAYAKEVLSVIPPADIAKSRTVDEAIREASAKPTYYIPFQKNLHFVGRRDELAVLRQRLLIDQDCQKMSIVGLGGTGKTQVALQFVYTVKEARPEWSIFWMPALSMESFEQACVQDGKEDAKELVKQYLSSSRAGRWLLVVDNADDPDIFFGVGQSKGIVDYLPESEEGVTVYTTRTPEVAELTRGDVVEIGAMERHDAADFLTKSLTRKDLLRSDATASKLLDELLDDLACLPLAIAQAAAYLNRNRMSIAKYLWLLHNTEQDLVRLMSSEFRDDTRYKDTANAVATTWVVSFSQIRERDAVAADLLAFMSCVEWKAIPRSLLPGVQLEGRMEEAIGTLFGYSFLVRRDSSSQATEEGSENGGKGEEGEEETEAEEWYDIHRLVHLATRIWVKKHGDASEVAEGAVRHIAGVFPSDDYANRRVWRAYLPHALRLLDGRRGYDAEEQAELCLLVGRCLRVDGRIQEAVRWLEESYRRRNWLDEDDMDRLSSEHNLAGAYEADGQVKKAVDLLEHVVAVREKVLAEDHPSRLHSQHELARAYQADGQVPKAVKLLEAVVEVREKILLPEHPDRLASQQVLAVAYHADGQVQKAVALLEAVVEVQEKTLLPEHPDRLASQHALAAAYRADGQVQKAVELLEAVVEVQEKMLLPEHPSRLASQHVLAGAYQADGQVQKAIELLERVVEVQKAVALLEAVVEMKEKTLLLEHPSRLASQHALAMAYQADGQVQKAVDLLERVVEVEEKILVPEHPDRLASLQVLAMAYEADGQVRKAVDLLERVVEVEERMLVPEHSSRLASQHALAIAYHADGQVQKAVDLLERVVEIKARVLRADHPSRLVSVEALTDLYAEQAVESDEALSSASFESSPTAGSAGHAVQQYD